MSGSCVIGVYSFLSLVSCCYLHWYLKGIEAKQVEQKVANEHFLRTWQTHHKVPSFCCKEEISVIDFEAAGIEKMKEVARDLKLSPPFPQILIFDKYPPPKSLLLFLFACGWQAGFACFLTMKGKFWIGPLRGILFYTAAFLLFLSLFGLVACVFVTRKMLIRDRMGEVLFLKNGMKRGKEIRQHNLYILREIERLGNVNLEKVEHPYPNLLSSIGLIDSAVEKRKVLIAQLLGVVLTDEYYAWFRMKQHRKDRRWIFSQLRSCNLGLNTTVSLASQSHFVLSLFLFFLVIPLYKFQILHTGERTTHIPLFFLLPALISCITSNIFNNYYPTIKHKKSLEKVNFSTP